MTMIKTIAAKELTSLRRDGRLPWAGGIVVALVIAGLSVGWERQREVASERAAAQALDYDDWLAQPERHPHNAAHQGMHVFKPDPALSIVDPGIDPYVGSTLWLQAHRQSELAFMPAQDATGLQRFGELSAAWVLQVLGPLLVIVLGFDAFAGERELGTLRQTLSLGLSARRLLWGKALGQLSALAILLVPAAAIAAVIVIGRGSSIDLDAAARLGWLSLGYSAYLAMAVFAVLAVSALARSSRIALVTLLGLWIATTLLAPRVASDLSRTWHPNPTRLAFNADLGSEMGQVAGQAWKEQFGVSQWAPNLPLDKWGLALQVDDHAGYSVMDRHFARLWDTFGEQQRAQEWLGLVAPVMAVRAFSMAIAGTDFAHYRVFSLAAERHRRLLQDVMSADLVENADPRGTGHFDYRAAGDLWSRVPPFTYTPPPVSWAIGNSGRSLTVLSLTLLLTMVAAHIAVGRRQMV
jgi:ABC-2 type transport system permease protein